MSNLHQLEVAGHETQLQVDESLNQCSEKWFIFYWLYLHQSIILKYQTIEV